MDTVERDLLNFETITQPQERCLSWRRAQSNAKALTCGCTWAYVLVPKGTLMAPENVAIQNGGSEVLTSMPWTPTGVRTSDTSSLVWHVACHSVQHHFLCSASNQRHGTIKWTWRLWVDSALIHDSLDFNMDPSQYPYGSSSNGGNAHPQGSSKQPKAATQKLYRDRESELFNELRTSIAGLTHQDPSTRHDILTQGEFCLTFATECWWIALQLPDCWQGFTPKMNGWNNRCRGVSPVHRCKGMSSVCHRCKEMPWVRNLLLSQKWSLI